LTSNFENFTKQLDEAVDLLENSSIVKKTTLVLPNNMDSLIDTQSLLERCNSVCMKNVDDKPTIRIIHHFPCSGGALLTECLSVMPNVFIVSEIHPLSKSYNVYSPSDLARSIINANIPSPKNISEKLFLSNIKAIHKHVELIGGELVIRDNAYYDYLYGESVTGKTIVNLLEKDFNVISVVLYRDAIDTYASFIKETFQGEVVLSFDDFCKRTTHFLSDYKEAEIFRCEALESREEETVESIARSLDIKFSELYKLIKHEPNYQQLDSWKANEIDSYNSKLDTKPTNKEIGESNEFITLQKITKDKNKIVILIATMPRSGSTWLYNCVCEIHKLAEKEFYSCWIDKYDPTNDAPIHIVKAHNPEWYLSSQADFIISSRRDVRDVVGSLIRMGWANKEQATGTVERLINTVHPFWYSKSDIEINYPDINAIPEEVITSLCQLFNINLNEHEVNSIKTYLNSLKSPDIFDEKTQLHPHHRANDGMNYSEFVGEDLYADIENISAEWLNRFNYVTKSDRTAS
jgi:hypothetical protein